MVATEVDACEKALDKHQNLDFRWSVGYKSDSCYRLAGINELGNRT